MWTMRPPSSVRSSIVTALSGSRTPLTDTSYREAIMSPNRLSNDSSSWTIDVSLMLARLQSKGISNERDLRAGSYSNRPTVS